MKRAHVILVVVGVAIAAAAAGYWVGLRQGDASRAFAMAMRAPTSVMYLEAIWDGKINGYAMLVESIDETLLANHHLEEGFVFRLLPPFSGVDAETSRRESLTRLANYRKGNHSPYGPENLEALRARLPESERENLPEMTPALRESMLKAQKTIDEMVGRYANKASQGQ